MRGDLGRERTSGHGRFRWLFIGALLVAVLCAGPAAGEWVSVTGGSLDGKTLRLRFDRSVDPQSAAVTTNYALMLVRKEVKDLTSNEVALFVTAVSQMKRTPSMYDPRTNAYDYFVGLHLQASDDHAAV